MNLSTVYRALQGLTVYRRLLDQPVTGALTALIHAAARQDADTLCAAWGHLCAL